MDYGALLSRPWNPRSSDRNPSPRGFICQDSLQQWSYPWKEHWPLLRPYLRVPPRPQDEILSRSPPLAADGPPHARGSLPWAGSGPRIRQHREGLSKGATSLCPTCAPHCPMPTGCRKDSLLWGYDVRDVVPCYCEPLNLS